MVDLDCKAKMVSSNIPAKSPRLSNNFKLQPLFINPEISAASDEACNAYEHYLRLPELRRLCSATEFTAWKIEHILKPALIALEISFRFVSTVVSDTRPYVNRREWRRRLEELIATQLQIIALLMEEDDENAPIVDSEMCGGALARGGSFAEMRRDAGESTVVVSRVSEASLLPRLGAWEKSEAVAEKILYSIECEMQSCRYTLGLGEPNLAGKPSLDYDAVCKPSELHALKKPPIHVENNHENQTVYATHQILECWIFASHALLERVNRHVEEGSFSAAANECNIIERIWKLLSAIEELHLLTDPEDFLRLKNQLKITSGSDTCFKSRGLVAITRLCKDLKHKVPAVLGVEADPMGGPRLQEAAMRLYKEKTGSGDSGRVHLLQAMQSIEAAVKRFYFSYKQVLVVLMGSLDANVGPNGLSGIYMEPTYFPSLDAAKTFLGAKLG